MQTSIRPYSPGPRILSIFLIVTSIFHGILLPPEIILPFTLASEITPQSAAPLIQIPAELGKVEERIDGPAGAPLLIHIQSAHGHYEAQKNIQKILEHLRSSYGIDLLLLEGGKGKLHPEYFHFFENDPALN